MGFVIWSLLILIGIFLAFNFGTTGMALGCLLVFMASMSDPNDLNFLKKDEEIEEDFIPED